MKKIIPAGQFKAKCLKLMEEVKASKRSYVITKRNVPIVKIVPVESEDIQAFGSLKGTIHFLGDIISPIDEEWNASR
jgi:prevent-host-death family protein